MSRKFTRGKFLEGAGAGAAWIALTNSPGCAPALRPPNLRTFRSRPDISPPAIDVVTQAQNTTPGYIFVAPKEGGGQNGPLILDESGQPVWFGPLQRRTERAMDFKVQRYRGEPVLTFWEGVRNGGYGLGECVILDSSYRELRRVRAGNGYEGDHHEFLITPEDTALITISNPVPADLSSVGGPKDGRALDGIVQEIDIQSGKILFEWHSLDHVGLDESYRKPPKESRWPFGYFHTRKVFDYFHLNSIDVDHDSNLLVSARWTFTVYKIERESGEVLWRLGGKKSSFEMGPGTRTRYQHDARRQPDGTITIFDNGGRYKDKQSYGLVLEVDEDNMSATLVRKYSHPDKWRAATQGNMQVLPNGNVFVGWGSESVFSEFGSGGELILDARFPPRVESYRAFRFPWKGYPKDDPALAAETGPGKEEITLYASWNGATEVASWQALAGSSPHKLESVGASVGWEGFETAIRVRTAEPYVGVEARDSSGRVLGTSRALKPEN